MSYLIYTNFNLIRFKEGKIFPFIFTSKKLCRISQNPINKIGGFIWLFCSYFYTDFGFHWFKRHFSIEYFSFRSHFRNLLGNLCNTLPAFYINFFTLLFYFIYLFYFIFYSILTIIYIKSTLVFIPINRFTDPQLQVLNLKTKNGFTSLVFAVKADCS